MASGFFALFDDIAVLMDDIATMGKVATKKTTAILGDDLAVNAEKSTGFLSTRELPVIWAITKGSFINKLIILPLIFLLSAFAQWGIMPLLMIGGLYLAYEGVEKIYEYFFPHPNHDELNHVEMKALTEEEILKLEKDKIKSAIFTDFILSLEIIIIALSTVADESLSIQIPVLIIVAIITTIGVYGIVALIVRMDDLGYSLIKKGEKKANKFLAKLGLFLVAALPWLIKILGVVGTLAMLMVAGSIYVHNIYPIHELLHKIPAILAQLLTGLVVGLVSLPIVKVLGMLVKKIKG